MRVPSIALCNIQVQKTADFAYQEMADPPPARLAHKQPAFTHLQQDLAHKRAGGEPAIIHLLQDLAPIFVTLPRL